MLRTDASIRLEVRSLACDNASHALYEGLKKAFPNLEYLVLDIVHLAIHYNQTQWKKTRPGELYLRKVMRKLTQIDPSKNAEYWGAPFCGIATPAHNAQEQRYRTMILNGTMQNGEATAVSQQLNDTVPFYSVLEFIRAMASVTSLYWAEVDKTTQIEGKKLSELLWCAAAPHRIQWYLNNTRLMHTIPADMRNLIANGSSSNESLHHEINVVAKNQPTPRHLDSVCSQMDVFQQGKLLSHNTALYSPTTSAMNDSDVLALRVASLCIPDPYWIRWCDGNASVNSHRYGSKFKLRLFRKATLKKLREKGVCLRKVKNKAKKRTPSSLVRLRRSQPMRSA